MKKNCFFVSYFSDAKYFIHVCKPCKDGLIQPFNDTLDKCYPPPSWVIEVPDEDDKSKTMAYKEYLSTTGKWSEITAL